MGRKGVIIAVVAVMTILFALLALSPGTFMHASDPFTRYQSFVSSHPNFKAIFTSKSNGSNPIHGTLLVERPGRLLLSCSYADSNYTASLTEQGYVEIERGSQTYDESPPPGALGIFSSRISSAFQAAPGFLLSPNLSKSMPPKPTVASNGTSDVVHGSAKNAIGSADIWATVNQTGEITDLRVKRETQGHVSDQTWSISYQFPSHLRQSDFLTPIPAGYMPFALDRTLIPLQKGKTLPTDGWTRHGSSASVNLLSVAGHKPFLLAILDSEAPSEGAKGSLKALEAQLPVIMAGTGGTMDASAGDMTKINAPGSPTFFLADSSGKVVKIWYGYDADNKSAFESDVLSALNEVQKAK